MIQPQRERWQYIVWPKGGKQYAHNLHVWQEQSKQKSSQFHRKNQKNNKYVSQLTAVVQIAVQNSAQNSRNRLDINNSILNTGVDEIR